MSIGPELAQAWERTLQVLLGSREIAGVNKAMLRDTFPLGLVEDTVLVAAPNEFTQKTLETRLRPALTAALGAELGREIKLAVTVETRPESAPTHARNGFSAASPASTARGNDPGPDQPFEDDEDDEDADDESVSGSRGGLRAVGNAHGSARVQPRSHPPARLNPKYTFENFVIGNSNRFAHAAAYAAAEIGAYNPLFIYGDSGLGKTHLLHAIGHYSEAFFPQHRVKYFTTEEFTNDFINLVHAGRAEDFRRRYRDVDLLLIDDVQFLERAERTQEEFFHTFNTLHNATKQIVISSDRPPKQLTTLEERLRTRFEWGLCADVHAPDLETRIAILRMKADGDVLPRLSGEVVEYIASRIQTNIRELEGALIRVNAYGSLNRCDVTVQLAEEVLRDQFPDTQGPQITATLIVSVTSEYFALDSEDIKGGGRNRVLVNARQIAMYLCREMTELSLPQIGTIFGNKDHTTVMHAVRKINALMAERRQVFQQVTELTARIKARARQ